MRQGTLSVVLVLFLLIGLSASVWAQDGGGLTPAQIKELRSTFQDNAQMRAIQNALTSVSIRDIAESRDILVNYDHKFSHKIKTKGISNQKGSGRCWMFAGFNTIKPELLKNLDIDSFEFSHIYLQFYDKLEKANSFLEYMIEYRDRDIQDRDVVFYLKSPCPDGGYWENFANLVGKYGVIPKDAMAESASSDGTGMMNSALARILRKDAVELREIYKETGSVRKMRDAKEAMLAEVYRILVLNLGEPPQEFTWRHKVKNKPEEDEDDDKADDQDDADDDEDEDEDEAEDDDYDVEQNWSELRTYTPKEFYDEYVGLDLTQWVNLADDPIRPKGGHYEVGGTKNFWDGDSANYANVDIETIKKIAIEVLLDNQAVYFAANVSPDQDSGKGIMARGLYDYESVYDLDMGLTKKEHLLYRDGTINHGMAFIGVDLKDDQPVKWLVENSWGSSRGKGGLWTMMDNWFDDNVYNIIVHRDYVPEHILEVLEQPAKKLPPWDPMW